jgi:hypothetical protein
MSRSFLRMKWLWLATTVVDPLIGETTAQLYLTSLRTTSLSTLGVERTLRGISLAGLRLWLHVTV